MKKLLLAIIMCLLVLGCGKSGSKSDEAKPSAETGVPQLTMIKAAPRILLEAEAGTIEPPMIIDEDPNASGGKFVQAPEGPEHTEINKGGSVTFEFEVEEPGEYVLWIRKNWCCGCGNSLTLSADNGKEITFGGDATYRKWDWKRAFDPASPGMPLTLNLAKGRHSLKVGNREDGSKFDQVLFTQDNEYVPVAIEK